MSLDDNLYILMERMQDVEGWKSIIFLPFHFAWQITIIISILLSYIIISNKITYDLEGLEMTVTAYFCDALYLVDLFCSVLHLKIKSTRKLKNFKVRPWFVLTVDFISLIPFELMYKVLYYSEKEFSKEVYNYMSLNRVFRLYRIYMYCSQSAAWKQNINLSFLVNYIVLFMYGTILTHAFACIFHTLKSEAELKLCPASELRCIFLNEANIFFLTVHRFIGNETSYNSMEKRILCIISMTIGYLYVNALMIPILIFSCKKILRPFFEIWNRYKGLEIYINNMIDDETLKVKTLREFRSIWTYGKGNLEPELLKSFPLSLRKHVFSDVYWEAIRHSEIFQSISSSCKRSLALSITGDFFSPGTIFWEFDETKNCMLYISSGVIQIMAEENNTSPILSLTAGTILGESNMFWSTKSKALLRVTTFSEIHILRAEDFFHIIQYYPEDRDLIWSKLRLRLQIAMAVQYHKNENNKQLFQNTNKSDTEYNAIKWIKTQTRNIYLAHESYSAISKENFDRKLLQVEIQRLNHLKVYIEHTSLYLPLINLGEDTEVLKDLMCLKTSIPWVIDPQCHFIKVWEGIILVFNLFSSIVYPVFVAWWYVLPTWLFSISVFITLSYIIDVFLQLSTAIKKKDSLIIHPVAIFRYRLRSLTFYADILSALPLQIFILYFGSEATQRYMGLSIVICVLKQYRVFFFLTKWCKNTKGRLTMRIMMKFFFFHCLLIYWSAAILHLADVKCMFYSCQDQSWYNESYAEIYPEYKNLGAPFFAIKFLMDVPNTQSYVHSFSSNLVILSCLIIFQFMSMSWFGEYNAAYMLQISHEVKYKSLLHSVINFMDNRRISERIKRRVMHTLNFQWLYNRGDSLTQERTIFEDAPRKLKYEVNKHSIFKTIKMCAIFESEDEDFIWSLCEQSDRLVLPSNSVLITYGSLTMKVYIIYKGFVQLNSFLPRDCIDGWGQPILYGPGDIFPIIIALNQMPSGVTARTLTDCELIVLNLEDILTMMIIHNCFNDFVEVIKLLDLEPFRKAQLSFSKVGHAFKVKNDSYMRPFTKLGLCAWIPRLFLRHKSINNQSQKLMNWEIMRTITIVISVMGWPVALGILDYSRKYVIYSLLGLDIFAYIDFYIRMHISYYNNKGIHVIHPLSTAWHYLTTSFLVDFIIFIPHLQSLYILSEDLEFKINDFVVYSHSLIRMIGLYRVFFLFGYYQEIKSSIALFNFIRYLIIIIVFLNTFIALKIHSEINVIINPDGSSKYELSSDSWIKTIGISGSENPTYMYLIMLYCVSLLIFRSYPIFFDYTLSILVMQILLPCLGTIFVMYIQGFFVSWFTASNMNFIIYQYHMKSLINYLREQNAENNICKAATEHFEHEWERKRGEDLQSIFRRFPNILQEDLMFPIYEKTITGIPCLAKANEAFHRILARSFTELHLRKGSTIIFHKEVNNNIYFVHRGECDIKGKSIILYKGSIIGDIKGTGKMTNNITAKTHVHLLSISSPNFFLILNNFFSTEREFFEATEEVDDFMKSIYIMEIKEEIIRIQKKRVEVLEESFFERTIPYGKNLAVNLHKKAENKKSIDPDSKLAKFLRIIFVFDAIATTFIIPVMIGLHIENMELFIIIYLLDIIWIVKIIISFRMAYIDRDTGSIIFKPKLIMRKYLGEIDGFVIDFLSIIPFELVCSAFELFYDDWMNHEIKNLTLAPRLLRFFSLWYFLSKLKKKLSINNHIRWIIIILKHFITINFLSSIYLIIATDNRLSYEGKSLGSMQEVLVWSYFATINLHNAVGIYIFPPKNLWEIIFFIFVTIMATIQKCILSNEVLSVINVSHYMKSEKEYKLLFLINYMKNRNISPSLRKELLSYGYNLLSTYEAEVMPWFLLVSPYFIKVQIMQDLYMIHLEHCYIFQALNIDFLKQLAARLERHVYFPTDTITDKGDVDSNIYFVHKGEVSCIESHKLYPGLNYEVDIYKENEHFGIEQGLNRSIPHFYTFRAKTTVDILNLNFHKWFDLRAAFPEENNIIQSRLKNVRQEEKRRNEEKGN